MKNRICLLSLALTLAGACLIGTAVTALNPPAAAAGSEEYLLKTHQGKVWVYLDGAPFQNTGISSDSLPAQDRTRLEEGISTSGDAALSSLLEDFGA